MQIGDENVHRVRDVMDEVFGENNFVSLITFRKKLMPLGRKVLEQMADFIIWYAKDAKNIKYRQLFRETTPDPKGRWTGVWEDGILRRLNAEERRNISSINSDTKKLFGTVSQWAPSFSEANVYELDYQGVKYYPTRGQCWVTTKEKMDKLGNMGRLFVEGDFPRYVIFHDDFSFAKLTSPWNDTAPAQELKYVVQTNSDVIQRCILMTTDHGDLVLDPTCGSGTTAYVAEQWGRRWITIDTSRVALALARARIMGARYPYYLLKDSVDGQVKEAEITGKAPSLSQTYGKVRHGFVYERVPHITLKSIANNTEIDVIYEEHQQKIEPLRKKLCELTHRQMEEWEIPHIAPEAWNDEARKVHAKWKEAKIARQRDIDGSISRHAEYEYLYDKPYDDKKKVRVAGPFTVESTAPHRMLYEDENGDVVDPAEHIIDHRSDAQSFVNMILDNLKVSGVQQAHKDEKIEFSYLAPWPGRHICAEGRYMRGEKTVRVGIYVGPEFGTVQREMLRDAAVECGDANFDELISCAFRYDALSTELTHVGKIKILPARMNNELHLSMDLKSTGTGNLFVIFGEPDVKIAKDTDGKYIVQVNGVDIYNPSTGAVKSSSPDEIACWFIDTNYNGESFFVRHAYFLGANDPYKALKTSLKAEINKDVWETLKSSVSRPFEKPETGKIAVKIINHLGDEAMKVYKV